MRRLGLSLVMVVMGVGLIAGSAVANLTTSLFQLEQEVGTNASAAAAALGVGLMAAASNPKAHIGWVRIGILYGPIVLGYQAAAHFALSAEFKLGPVVFGLACSLLLIALYPQRGRLLPPAIERHVPTPPPVSTPTT